MTTQVTTRDGEKLTMFDESRSTFDHHWKMKGFASLERAKVYQSQILDSWGYFPRADITESNGEIIVVCSMANSCD